MRILTMLSLAACAGMAGAADVEPIRPNYYEPNYDRSKIAPYELEDPLSFADGQKVRSREDWVLRRAEILNIFAKEMFGQEPPKPEAVVTEKFDEAVTLGGFGVRRQYRMWFKKDKSGPYVDWLLLYPAKGTGPFPVITFLNYDGNHQLLTDKEVRAPEGSWIRFTDDHQVDLTTRGICNNPNRDCFVLPAGMILARGYAILSACYCQVSPDPDASETDPAHKQDPFAYTGVFDLWPKRDPNRDDNTTAIGAWAWALSRGLDLAATVPELDVGKAVVTGYSRLGKTALLAAARDERFAACVPNQCGGGGCTLAKRDFGENVATEVSFFSHWFCKAYKKYEKNPAKLLTFDQHLLLASIAPRGLLVQGFDAQWFDTEGEYLACKAASPAWKFLGQPGLPDVAYPGDYSTAAIGKRLGYVRRDLWHGHAFVDWQWLLDFVDGVFKGQDDTRAQTRRETFERYAAGTGVGAMTGWSGKGTVRECAYEPPVPSGYPMPSEPHAKVLEVNDTATRQLSADESGTTRIDAMVCMRRAEGPLKPFDASVKFALLSDSEGRLCLWHSYAEGGAQVSGWHSVSERTFSDGEWLRVGIELDDTTNPQGLAFGRIRINGSLCATSFGVRSPADMTPFGSWHRLASCAAGGEGCKPS